MKPLLKFKDFVNESVNEARGPETVKEPKSKDIQVKDKYKKGEGIFYRTTFAASPMVANSKSETSKSVYYARIDKVSKDGRGNPLYVVGWDKVPHDMVIGAKLNESEVNELLKAESKKLENFIKKLASKISDSKIVSDVKKFMSSRSIDPYNTYEDILHQIANHFDNNKNITSLIKMELHENQISEASTLPIDNQKLDDYARSIGILCNGEYGTVYHNELENSVFVCLGDSHPFDVDSLVEYMKDAISADYHTRDMIKIIIENECGPTGDGWKQIN
jgi:hypothetical protein